MREGFTGQERGRWLEGGPRDLTIHGGKDARRRKKRLGGGERGKESVTRQMGGEERGECEGGRAARGGGGGVEQRYLCVEAEGPAGNSRMLLHEPKARPAQAAGTVERRGPPCVPAPQRSGGCSPRPPLLPATIRVHILRQRREVQRAGLGPDRDDAWDGSGRRQGRGASPRRPGYAPFAFRGDWRWVSR